MKKYYIGAFIGFIFAFGFFPLAYGAYPGDIDHCDQYYHNTSLTQGIFQEIEEGTGDYIQHAYVQVSATTSATTTYMRLYEFNDDAYSSLNQQINWATSTNVSYGGKNYIDYIYSTTSTFYLDPTKWYTFAVINLQGTPAWAGYICASNSMKGSDWYGSANQGTYWYDGSWYYDTYAISLILNLSTIYDQPTIDFVYPTSTTKEFYRWKFEVDNLDYDETYYIGVLYTDEDDNHRYDEFVLQNQTSGYVYVPKRYHVLPSFADELDWNATATINTNLYLTYTPEFSLDYDEVSFTATSSASGYTDPIVNTEASGYEERPHDLDSDDSEWCNFADTSTAWWEFENWGTQIVQGGCRVIEIMFRPTGGTTENLLEIKDTLSNTYPFAIPLKLFEKVEDTIQDTRDDPNSYSLSMVFTIGNATDSIPVASPTYLEDVVGEDIYELYNNVILLILTIGMLSMMFITITRGT